MKDFMTPADQHKLAQQKNIIENTLICSSIIPLILDVFRSGGKNKSGVDYLRWEDLIATNPINTDKYPLVGRPQFSGLRKGRIEPKDWDTFHVFPGAGISMFIQKQIGDYSHWVKSGPITKGDKKTLEADLNTKVREQYWWKIPANQFVPQGLLIVYDGDPFGHCTLTVEHPISINSFLQRAANINFEQASIDIIKGS